MSFRMLLGMRQGDVHSTYRTLLKVNCARSAATVGRDSDGVKAGTEFEEGVPSMRLGFLSAWWIGVDLDGGVVNWFLRAFIDYGSFDDSLRLFPRQRICVCPSGLEMLFEVSEDGGLIGFAFVRAAIAIENGSREAFLASVRQLSEGVLFRIHVGALADNRRPA